MVLFLMFCANREQIQTEAEDILKQLEEIECSASSKPKPQPPKTRVLSPSPQGRLFSSIPQLLNNRALSPLSFGSRQSTLERKPRLGGRLSKSSSDLLARPTARAMRIEGTSEQEDAPSPADNRLYGLQALNKLDNAVNGKVNNLYRDSSNSDYGAPPKMNNFTPPKPPRKAPSSSPPSYRKGYASLDELEFVAKRNNVGGYEGEGYDQGYPYSGPSNPSLDHLRSRSPSRQSPFARQSPVRGGGFADYSQSPSRGDYSRQSPSRGDHSRQSPSRDYRQSPSRDYRQSPSRDYRQSPSRDYRQSPTRGGNHADYSRHLSPSRENHTDNEILSSPSQVCIGVKSIFD